jgi:hypothetical protein
VKRLTMRSVMSLVVHRRKVQGEPANIEARLQHAEELTRSGRYDEATIEHVWLWEHMLDHDPSMAGVRVSFFAYHLKTLVAAHAPARAAISQLRDRAAPPASGPIEREAFGDWICLNGVLGEKGRSLAWYDGLPPEKRVRLGPLLLEHYIIPLLVEVGRWAEAGALYAAPLTTIDHAALCLSLRPADLRAELVELGRKGFVKDASQLVRALRAAGRLEEAGFVAQRARTVSFRRDGARARRLDPELIRSLHAFHPMGDERKMTTVWLMGRP